MVQTCRAAMPMLRFERRASRKRDVVMNPQVFVSELQRKDLFGWMGARCAIERRQERYPMN